RGRSSSRRQCRLSQIHADGDLEPVLKRTESFQRYLFAATAAGAAIGSGWPRENRDVSVVHEMLALVELNPRPRWSRGAHRGIVVRMKVDGVQEASWSNRSCLSGSGF